MKVHLLYPAQHSNGSTLPPGWYDREEVPEAAFACGFVYTPPEVPAPGAATPPHGDGGDTLNQTKSRGKSV